VKKETKVLPQSQNSGSTLLGLCYRRGDRDATNPSGDPLNGIGCPMNKSQRG